VFSDVTSAKSRFAGGGKGVRLLCKESEAMHGRAQSACRAHLLIDIGDGLLALPVHVEDLQEGFVDTLVIAEACLQCTRGLVKVNPVVACRAGGTNPPENTGQDVSLP
jgi:hypothetical protein